MFLLISFLCMILVIGNDFVYLRLVCYMDIKLEIFIGLIFFVIFIWVVIVLLIENLLLSYIILKFYLVCNVDVERDFSGGKNKNLLW